MKNSTFQTTITSSQENDILLTLISYIPLILIAYGVIGNLTTFCLLTFNRSLRKITSLVYLSFSSITGTLSLFVWNLDHYLIVNYKFNIEYESVVNCRIFPFIQYFSLQSFGLLLSMLCIDRYITIISKPGSFASRLPFRTRKSAVIWSIIIMTLVFVFNSHILILNGTYETKDNKSLNLICYVYTTGFKLNPLWENLHLIIYSLITFMVMSITNILLIKKTSLTKKPGALLNKKSKSDIKKWRATVSQLIITVLFLVFSLPTSILYGFFIDVVNIKILFLIDSLSFLYNSSIFLICFVSYVRFRRVIIFTIKIQILSWNLSKKLKNID